MSEESAQTTTVKIYNQTYQVRSGNDPDYVRLLAKYVDQRMSEVFEGTATVDSLRIAVLAALNIADEYFSAKNEMDTLQEAVVQRSQRLSDLLEPVLDPEPD